MDTSKITVGGREWTLAELNRYQGMAILDAPTKAREKFTEEATRDEAQAELNVLRTRVIIWSLNNVSNWPTREQRFGSETEPFSEADLLSTFTLKSTQECMEQLFAECLKLNGLLRVTGQGEPIPETADQSTGAVSVTA